MKEIYLDYAAATPVDQTVLQAMEPYWREQFYNPSALYQAARQTKKALEQAREQVADILGARPVEIIFAAGGTEANNLAIRGVMEQFPDSHAVASVIEHDAVLEPIKQFDHTLVIVNEQGIVDEAAVRQAITDRTVLVSIMYANNEIGTIQPIRALARLVTNIRSERQKVGNARPLYLHTDACQAAAYLDLHVARLGVDMMTLNGGKMYGPKQSGMLYVRTGTQLRPQILGGGQERGVRSGTENIAGSIGFSTALQLVQSRRKDESDRLASLQKLFIDLLMTEVPQAIINGSRKHRLPNNVHITLPGYDNERLLMQLDEAGIRCGLGSACSASNEQASHVLQAIGLSEEAARSSLRFTMGSDTSEADIKNVAAVLKSYL